MPRRQIQWVECGGPEVLDRTLTVADGSVKKSSLRQV
jgi:hypothetical protein